MWCPTCQQDVPALGAASEGTLRCGKCNGPFAAEEQLGARGSYIAPVNETPAPTGENGNQPLTFAKLLRNTPLSNEDWAIEAELRGVERLLSSLKSRPSAMDDAARRLPPHFPSSPEKKDFAADTRASAETRHQPPVPQPRAHALAWTILSIGLAIFACGAVLLGWSFIGRREDLWPIGMPLTLIGQAGLILGLVLQLDGLWNSNRQTATVLSNLDDELKTVREATALLSTSHSQGAQSFYLHLAEGASPHMLLADLKGQMDLLAQQMARHSRP